VLKTMAYSMLGDVMLLAHVRRPPDASEWTTYVAEIGVLLRGPRAGRIVTLVLTEGGGPNADQRKELNDVLAGRKVRGAVLSNALIVRSIVTALSWWNPLIRAFRQDALVEALEYLQIDRAELPAVLTELNRLRGELLIPPLA
jgi:hypothetical protein